MIQLSILEPAYIKASVTPMLLHPLSEAAYGQLSRYLQLLYRWNERMNLTAVRDPAVLIKLHLAECLRAAQLIPEAVSTVLDFGSGAGLPGIPMKIARPELFVTLAESQTKKAAFLQEAVRELGFSKTTVISDRVENLPTYRSFNLVAMRAVDRMSRALAAARLRIKAGGCCMVLTSEAEIDCVREALPALSWRMERTPGTLQRVVLIGSQEG
jgi:16S rRNA (guanine527-N7)-methyltransferase